MTSSESILGKILTKFPQKSQEAITSARKDHPNLAVITYPGKLETQYINQLLMMFGASNSDFDSQHPLCVCNLHQFSPDWINPGNRHVTNADGKVVGNTHQVDEDTTLYLQGNPDRGYAVSFIIALAS